MNDKLIQAMTLIAEHLEEIRGAVFKPGLNMKLTFMARDPANPEADLMVSDDEIPALIDALHRQAGREDVSAEPFFATPAAAGSLK